MGCLGTLIVVACIGAFVAVLIHYPKQTVGCGIALVLVIIIVVAVVLQNDREQTARSRERDNAIVITVVYSAGKCGAEKPLAVSVRNGTSETLDAVEMRLEAYRPGFSTDLLESSYDEHTLKWDKVLSPTQTETLCYPLPHVLAAPTVSPSALEFRIGYKYPRFH
jgi:hypothetical protein